MSELSHAVARRSGRFTGSWKFSVMLLTVAGEWEVTAASVSMIASLV